MSAAFAQLTPLKAYLPPDTFELTAGFLVKYRVHLTVTRERLSVLGNYSLRGGQHRITVNGNLNAYSFLITLLHELAHLVAIDLHGARIAAHGREWKAVYAHILSGFLNKNFFPADVELELMKTLENPSASTCAEANLTRVLKKYDKQKPDVCLLEELPQHAFFRTRNGKVYQKGDLLRKRFMCRELSTGRFYSVSPVATVKKIDLKSPG